MNHIYNEIEGWFRPETAILFKQAVVKAPEKASFVEVGSWKGKSASCMAVEIINSGKDITLTCVDHWDNDRIVSHKSINPPLEDFLTNIAPVSSVITTIQKDSVDASKSFLDNSLDVIFIDAGHSYKLVTQDLNAWYPKLKFGGIMIGDDYQPGKHDGVIQAVNHFFHNNGTSYSVLGNAWIITKHG